MTRSSGDGPEQTVASDTGSALTEYADAGLSPETAYAYRVTALNDLGPGPDSDAFSVTTAAPAVDPDLPAPAGLGSSFDEEGRVTLGWDEPQGSSAAEVTGYRILRGPDAESLAPLVRDTGNTATSWTDPTASEGATYVYAVRSRTAGTMSELSDPLTVTALAPPADLAGDDAPGGGVLLSWSAPEGGQVTGYRVLRGPDAGSLEALAEDSGSAEPLYLDATAEPGTAYFYAVRALYSHGAGPVSGAVKTVAPSLPPPTLVVVDPEPAAQQQSGEEDGETLIGNLGEARNHSLFISIGDRGDKLPDIAQAVPVTTGPNPGGYAVEGVQVVYTLTGRHECDDHPQGGDLRRQWSQGPARDPGRLAGGGLQPADRHTDPGPIGPRHPEAGNDLLAGGGAGRRARRCVRRARAGFHERRGPGRRARLVHGQRQVHPARHVGRLDIRSIPRRCSSSRSSASRCG